STAKAEPPAGQPPVKPAPPAATPVPPMLIDPEVDVALSNPIGGTRVIEVAVRNSGAEDVVDAAVLSLRCFLISKPDDPAPGLIYQGLENIDEVRPWWSIGTLKPGPSVKKDATKFADDCLKSKVLNPPWQRF